MTSYTFGTDDFLTAVSQEQQKLKNGYGGNQFPLQLNTNDFLVFITILRDLALYGEATRSTRVAVAEILGTGTDEIEPIEEWSADMLGAIAESLGVDGI